MFSIEYRYFLQAAKDLSLRRASSNLNVNSSAVVRQIKKLEFNLDCKLFLRNSRGLSLTNEGNLLYKFLNEETLNIDTFNKNFTVEKGRVKGDLNIGMMESIGSYFLSPSITKFNNYFPDIRFIVKAKKPENIVDELIENKIQIGITFSDILPRPIKKLFERNFPIGILTSENHPLQYKNEVLLEDLKKFPLIFHTGAVTYMKQMKRELGLKQKELNPHITTNSVNFIKKFLTSSKNSIALSLKGTTEQLDDNLVKFREISNPVMQKNRIGIIVLRSKKFTDYEQKFIQMLISEFNSAKY